MVQKPEKTSFKPSRYSIRVKLIGIISSLVLVALSGMIFLASSFFTAHSEVSVQENNLNLVRSTAEWTESEIRYIRRELEALDRFPALHSERESSFFQKNPHFIYVGLSKGGPSFPKRIYNQQMMQVNQISPDNIEEINSLNKYHTQGLAEGQLNFFNASQKGQALLGICQKINDKLLLLYMDPERILQNFKLQKTVTTFMVNERGDVVLHPDLKVILARSNFFKEDIVKKMWQTPISAGQTQYLSKLDNTVYMASYKKLTIGDYGIIAQVSRDVAFEPVNIIRNRNIIIMFIFLTISVILIYFFAKLISRPIVSLVKATHQVAEGNYSLDIVPRSGDEVGQLTYAFRNMATGLGEREKMKDAFGKFVNKEIAEQVLKGDIKLGGESKKAAIFFSDLRGFTAISEGLKPEKVVAFLNAYFTEMVNCILQTHGVVDKYIGDAIMAHWGAISGQGNHTENAIDAGLYMRKALLAFNQNHKGHFPIAKMGSGINTGTVISGQIGSEKRLEYTVIGDTVNLASRIEALNKPFGTDLLISESAYNEVEGIFKLVPMPTIKVKGKKDPQKIYAVLGRHDDSQAPKSLSELRQILDIKDTNQTSTVDTEAKEEKFEILAGQEKQ